VSAPPSIIFPNNFFAFYHFKRDELLSGGGNIFIKENLNETLLFLFFLYFAD
jgi:hypothetical protein